MFRPLARSHRRPHRRGTSFVLIVVVMISFAAAVGVAFALFAGQTLRINTAQKEGQGGGGLQQPRAPEPTDIINQFFRTIIFGAGDDGAQDVTNALRGHDFAASMYGRPPGTAGWAGTTTPWNGVGTAREPLGTLGDRAEAVNFTQMRIGGQPYLLDPEHLGGPRTNGIATSFASVSNRTRVPKNAGYSFPDIKDFFLAQVDPATGQVLVPSFYREWLFGKLDPLNGGNSTDTTPTGPNNWFNDRGRLRILRPRPAEHPRFPRPGANADLTYTGDVQNWPGGYTYAVDPATANTPNPVSRYYGRNDSLWMYTGAPLVQFGNRKVVPMVAPLIVPLDGLFNASAHGNRMGANGAHFSSAGYGPWEVNLSALLGADAQNVVGSRAPTPIQRSGDSTVYADDYRLSPMQAYAPVAFSANDTAGNPVGAATYPAGPTLSGIPTFPGYQSDNLPLSNHPALYNPTQWVPIRQTGPNPAPRSYPLSDLRRLELRYAFNPDWYTAGDVTTIAPNTLIGAPGAAPGTYQFPFVYAVGQNTLNSYRLDTSHTNRDLLTTYAFSLDRPKLTPTLANQAPLEIVTLPDGRIKPGTVNAAGGGAAGAPQPYYSGGGTGTYTDFAGAGQLYNVYAALGSVNLNRPLADYRTSPAQPLQNANVNPANQRPDQDRRQLAHDIFVRLIVTLGAQATVTTTNGRTTYTIGAAPGSAQFNALRYLAQLAVNIVDYIDEDDVSTVFEWNPITLPGTPMKAPTDPLNPQSFVDTEIGNRVVFGAEKPRLVINEAYSELANDPQDGTSDPTPGMANKNRPLNANSNMHVRFWVELLNPSVRLTSPAAPNTANPLNDGRVVLSTGAYRLDITRVRRGMGMAAENVALDPTDMTGRRTSLDDPANVTGRLNLNTNAAPGQGVQPYLPDISYQFDANVADVQPNNGITQPVGDPAKGMLLVAPLIPPFTPGQGQGQPPRPKTEEFNPWPNQNAPPPPPWDKAKFVTTPNFPKGNGSPQAANSMVYAVKMTDTASDLYDQQYRRHMIMLRRLANPYVAAGPTNPFITVDAMDYVPAFDSVYRIVNQTDPRNARTANSNPPASDFDPPGERFSVGKVQPYAGYSVANQWVSGAGANLYNTYTFPQSMVLAQNPQAPTPPGQKTTFAAHNATGNNAFGGSTVVTNQTTGQITLQNTNTGQAETLMLPFDWLVHMDRALVNQIELFSVRDSVPHRVTQDFVRNAANVAPPQLSYEFGTGRWAFPDQGLARALEMLTVKPYTVGAAHGGRMPGQININALQDKRVLQGLFDPRGAIDQTFVDTAWSRWLESRNHTDTTTNGQGVYSRPLANGSMADTANTASKTVNEGGSVAGLHKPFMPFGGPVASAGSSLSYTAGASIDNTILRRDTFNGAPAPNAQPLLYTFNPVSGANQRGAAYMQQEPVRKVFNNITTVNHNYLVFLTIGYFEVDTETTNPVTGVKDGLVNLDGQASGGLTMPRIGQEAYLNVPGDLRQKVIAVVDMSGMFLESGSSAAEKPYFTTLDQTTYPAVNPMTGQFDPTIPVPLSVRTDGGTGVAFNGSLNPLGTPTGTPPLYSLYLGYGAEMQTVIVDPTNNPPTPPAQPGQPTTVMVTGLSRPVWGGSSVSNVRPGYAGPQGAFDYNDPKYKSVIPYLLRVK